jgi:hypothetical protein
MTLPDAVLAFKLLENAGLTKTERQLALTACSDLGFSSMKSALKRIFGDSILKSDDSDSAPIKIKQESAYYTQQRWNGGRQKKYSSDSSKNDVPKGTNPLNKYGKRTRCAICQSVFHWAKNCPDKKMESVNVAESENDHVESVHITLFSKEDMTDHEIFVIETSASAVIDTTCTQTVCGKKWLDDYVEKLPKQQRQQVITHSSCRGFKFGDGKVVTATKRVSIPAKIGSTRCRIDVEVVDVDIPLLLSKDSLKKARASLDIEHDKVVMFEELINVDFTSSGHYCINILDKSYDHDECIAEEECLISDDMTSAEQKKSMMKLHRQFGHASS